MMLNRSQYRGGLKSCPRCSVRKGVFVFHDMTRFGMRLNHGQYMIQSWCLDCRSIK